MEMCVIFTCWNESHPELSKPLVKYPINGQEIKYKKIPHSRKQFQNQYQILNINIMQYYLYSQV